MRNARTTRLLSLLLAFAALLPPFASAEALGCGEAPAAASAPACCCGSDAPVCPMAPAPAAPAPSVAAGCGCATPAPPAAPASERPRAPLPEAAAVHTLPASDAARAASAPISFTLVVAPAREAGRALLARNCVILI